MKSFYFFFAGLLLGLALRAPTVSAQIACLIFGVVYLINALLSSRHEKK